MNDTASKKTEAKVKQEFSAIDLEIKREIEVFIKLKTPDELAVSAMIGSWKETQSDEQVLMMLKKVNQQLQERNQISL